MSNTTSIILMIITIAIFAAATVIYISKRNKRKKMGADEFYTARNSTGWLQVGLSVEAVVMGCWALFSPAEAAVTSGFTGAIGYAVAQGVAIMLFAWLGVKLRKLVPEGSTMTEYALARYGKPMYWVAIISSIFYMGITLCSEMTGITGATQSVFGIPIWISAIALLVGVSIYTIYGGIKASLFADVLQTILILPTLLIAFVAVMAISGGWGNVIAQANAKGIGDMLKMNFMPGWSYGLSLLIAICAAGLFDNSFWQRTFACKDNETVKKSFLFAGALNIPLILICGIFGVIAMATIDVQNPSLAFFELLSAKAPAWLSALVMLCAIALVMSTMGAVMNGLSALIAAEAKRLKPDMDGKKLIRVGRISTIIVAIIAGFVALQSYGVLYLFLIADLVCAGAVVPCFYGMYNRKLKAWPAVIASIVGVGLGAIWFPDPTYATGNLLIAFAVALLASTVITIIAGCFGKPMDLDTIKDKINVILEEQAEATKDLEI